MSNALTLANPVPAPPGAPGRSPRVVIPHLNAGDDPVVDPTHRAGDHSPQSILTGHLGDSVAPTRDIVANRLTGR